ncbi:unnamed protein product [Prorocentrum cordatum]|uniref:Uncharacterized protein n=1 Tax=Prorocentrum cordatum TaxID=2364126 RepID=A0ABN9PZU3_9DINO|nr:unnamed protein product [Polarella glacialis]
MGSPGDFRFSDVPKPENYLHTYRDLYMKEHVTMLSQLQEGTQRFLRSLFDENFMANAQISSGFHYPVRTQYATLHMQLRVNSGSVCREDGRGVEVSTLIDTLKQDRNTFERDSEPMRYHVTENVKVSLLAAANEYEEQRDESAHRHVAPLAFELGRTSMPTIQDAGEDEEEAAEKDIKRASKTRSKKSPAVRAAKSPALGSADPPPIDLPPALTAIPDRGPCPSPSDEDVSHQYLVNLQPSPGSAFSKAVYDKRAECASVMGVDPTHMYPLHVSVTGFFEATQSQLGPLRRMLHELLQSELQGTSERIRVGEVICTSTGYVLFSGRTTGGDRERGGYEICGMQLVSAPPRGPFLDTWPPLALGGAGKISCAS